MGIRYTLMGSWGWQLCYNEAAIPGKKMYNRPLMGSCPPKLLYFSKSSYELPLRGTDYDREFYRGKEVTHRTTSVIPPLLGCEPGWKHLHQFSRDQVGYPVLREIRPQTRDETDRLAPGTSEYVRIYYDRSANPVWAQARINDSSSSFSSSSNR